MKSGTAFALETTRLDDARTLRIRLSLLARAARAVHTPPPRAAGGGSRLHRRDVLGPLPPLDARTGTVRLHLVVAGRRHAGDTDDVRHGLRARTAVPSGARRTGRRHAGRAVPRAFLAGGRKRRSPERVDHRSA